MTPEAVKVEAVKVEAVRVGGAEVRGAEARGEIEARVRPGVEGAARPIRGRAHLQGDGRLRMAVAAGIPGINGGIEHDRVRRRRSHFGALCPCDDHVEVVERCLSKGLAFLDGR